MQQPREVLKHRERTASLNGGFAFNISVKEPDQIQTEPAESLCHSHTEVGGPIQAQALLASRSLYGARDLLARPLTKLDPMMMKNTLSVASLLVLALTTSFTVPAAARETYAATGAVGREVPAPPWS